MKKLNESTTYYNYDAQEWKDDGEGFETFHIEQLDFLTSEKGREICHKTGNNANKLIKGHIKALEDAGLTANISLGFRHFASQY